jgi:hypothetical protein
VGVREFMLGMITIGLVAGIALGRSTERARRGYRDLGVAKAAVQKGRKIAVNEARRAVVTILLASAVLIAVFVGVIRLASGGG